MYSYIDKIVKELGGVIAVSELYRGKRYTGVGIVYEGNKPLNSLLHYYFNKRGKIVFFTNESLDVLEKFKDKVYFLVYEIDGNRVEDLQIPSIGIVYFELPTKSRLKQAFRPFEIYSGLVCRGRRCENIEGLSYIPTWRRNSFLFLCKKGDIARNVGGVITRPVENLLFSYSRVKAFTNIVMSLGAPVFG